MWQATQALSALLFILPQEQRQSSPDAAVASGPSEASAAGLAEPQWLHCPWEGGLTVPQEQVQSTETGALRWSFLAAGAAPSREELQFSQSLRVLGLIRPQRQVHVPASAGVPLFISRLLRPRLLRAAMACSLFSMITPKP